MKLLVLSDSHGREDYVTAIVYDHLDCDAILHCGDGCNDLDIVKGLPDWGDRPILQVRGNCDFGSELPVRLMPDFGDNHFYLTHGHMQQVKYGLDYIRLDAQRQGRDVVVFGHTHIPTEAYEDGVYLFNPGAAYKGRYGLIDIRPGTILFSHGELAKMDTF